LIIKKTGEKVETAMSHLTKILGMYAWM